MDKIGLNSSLTDVSNYCNRLWKRAIGRNSYKDWRTIAIAGNGLYEGGDAQWDPLDLIHLSANQEIPITVNVVAGFVDTLCGVENQSRYRTKAGVDSDGDEARLLGQALSSFLLQWQENQDVTYLDALKFKDVLCTGIGWTSTYEESGVLRYERIDPLEIIFDISDLSPQLTNSEFVGRMHWLTPEEIKLNFKNKVKNLDLNSIEEDTEFLSGAAYNKISPTVQGNSGGFGGKRLVCELQYKVPTIAYQGVGKNGRFFSTFDIESAEKLVEKEKDIEEFESKRILRTLFMRDTILSHSFLNPSYPDQVDFSYIPLVWKRKSTGEPYPFVEPLRGLQKLLNANFTKMTNSINSNRVFINGEINNLLPINDAGSAPDSLKKNIFSKNSVTVLPENTTMTWIDGFKLTGELLKLVEVVIELMKRVCGIYDDMRGGNSANTSGIAEQIRVSNSIRTNSFIFDHFSTMKKRVALHVIKLFQSTMPENIYIASDGDEYESIILNMTVEKTNGAIEIFHDVNFLPFNIFIEEVPNFKSSLSQRKEELMAFLNNPHANVLMMNPAFLDLFMDRGKEIAEGMIKAQQMLSQVQNNGKNQSGEGNDNIPFTQPQMTQGVLQNGN